MGVGGDCLLGFRLYWKAVFSIVWPFAILPVMLPDFHEYQRCFYVVLLMTGYWITEAIHMAITSMIPIVLFPLFSLMNTAQVCKCYMKDANMMFITGLVLALAVEYSRLHERIAIVTVDIIGASPRKLHIGIMIITAFISMWISNTAATAIMIPIVGSVLSELERNGVGKMFEEGGEQKDDAEDTRKPTKATMCLYISSAYASSIGGCATLIGTGTNLTFKGLFETRFREAPPIDFGVFMVVTFPIALIILILSTFILQLWYLGLLRPNSKDAQNIHVGPEGKAIAKNVVSERRKNMGPMTFHEIAVLLCFILAILLWIFRDPIVIPGWAKMLTGKKIKDSSVGGIIVLLLFAIPAKPDFIYAFSSDDEKRPKQNSTGLITWKFVYKKMPWGLVFLIGSGFAIAECARASKMNDYIVESMGDMEGFGPFAMMCIGSMAATILTQLTTNVAIANITVPIMGELARKYEINPLSLMYPTALGCSFAYMLPVSTPPNAIAAAPCNMKNSQMSAIGFVVMIVSWLVLIATAPFLGNIFWDFDTFPDWVEHPDNEVDVH